jgi:hypothetical protein
LANQRHRNAIEGQFRQGGGNASSRFTNRPFDHVEQL